MNDVTLLKRLCKSILQDRFNEEKYRGGSQWYGAEIHTQPMFCCYGPIGYTVYVSGSEAKYDVQYDYDMKELTIDEKPWKQMINIMILEDNDIYPISQWENETFELETYTDAGEDMIIQLDKLTKDAMLEYIDHFDINEEVLIWWPNGQKQESVPFDNIKEHYDDYELYLKTLRSVAKVMF